jgi:hypothetical protein
MKQVRTLCECFIPEETCSLKARKLDADTPLNTS